jgi:hypothetical protein
VQRGEKGFSFTITFRGQNLKLPQNFKGNAVVVIGSSVRGAFNALAKTRTD